MVRVVVIQLEMLIWIERWERENNTIRVSNQL